MRDFHLPGRSPVYATPRHGRHLDAGRDADRAGRAARRRQCAGRRGGRLRRAVRDRAAVHRHRRRLLLPLCPRRRRQGDRAERLRPRAGRRHDRLVRAARHHRAGQHLAACGHRARRDQRLGDAAEGARPQGAGRTAAAGDPLRRGRLAGAPEGGLGLEAAGGKLRKNGAHALPARRHGARTPATCSASRRWRRRCAPSPATAPRRSTKARSPPTWSPRCARAAACTPRRISPPACTTPSSSSRSR